MDAVVGRINDGVGAEEVREEPALFLLSGFICRVEVADKEPAGSAVAVDLLEAHAVKHEAHAAPGLVEIVRQNHGGGLAVSAVLDAGTGRDGLNLELLREFLLSLGFSLGGGIGIEFSVDAKREALEHFRFHRRIRRTRLPDSAFLIGARHHLNHRAVRDVDVGRAVVIALHAGAVLILLARGVCKVDHLADRAADDVLRKLRFIFGPFSFHVARLRVLLANHETDGGPEVLHHSPELFGRGIDAQPPIGSFLHHLRADGERNNLEAVGALGAVDSVCSRLFNLSNTYSEPRRRGNYILLRLNRRLQTESTAPNAPTASEIVPLTVRAKVMKEGTDRWLRVNAAPEQLWAVVQDFWPSVGLVVREQNPKTGYMETEWAENKAKLPQDIIRRTIGKVIDFAYSTGEQDQYRTRMERNDDGTTDIYISHRSMVEVVTGADKESTVWQPGPTDPTMEAEMLQRLALRIDAEFNPNASAEAEAEAQKELAQQFKVEPVATRARIENGADGKAAAVVLTDNFDQAWRRMGLVLDRMGFEQVDRDRTAGWFLVRYLDPAYEAAQKEKRGFFTNLFSSDAVIDAPNYRIHLSGEGAETRVTVQGPDGGEDATGVAPNILGLLAEQLR